MGAGGGKPGHRLGVFGLRKRNGDGPRGTAREVEDRVGAGTRRGGGTEVSGETSRGVGVVKSLSVNSRGTVVGRYVSSLAVSSFVSFFTLPSPGTTREIS